jgi:hypothetical protein
MSETRVVQYLDFPNETKSRSDSEYHVTCTFMRVRLCAWQSAGACCDDDEAGGRRIRKSFGIFQKPMLDKTTGHSSGTLLLNTTNKTTMPKAS